MQINRVQTSDNTSFTAFRFTKAAKAHIKDTFLDEEVFELKKLVDTHKNVSPDVLVGTDTSLFGSTRLRARVDGMENFDRSLFFDNGFTFLKSIAEYAENIYHKFGMSTSDALKEIYKR